MKTIQVESIPGLADQINAGEHILVTSGKTVIGAFVPLFSNAPPFPGLQRIPSDSFGAASDLDEMGKIKHRVKRIAGSMKGIWMSPDFDESLPEFKEYTE